MKNTVFTGAGVAIVTPMNADGSINYKKLRENIDFQIENGTDAIIICGTTGESSTLTDEEHVECIRVAVEQTNKRVPVIAGTGSNDTRYAIFLSKEAEAMGVYDHRAIDSFQYIRISMFRIRTGNGNQGGWLF